MNPLKLSSSVLFAAVVTIASFATPAIATDLSRCITVTAKPCPSTNETHRYDVKNTCDQWVIVNFKFVYSDGYGGKDGSTNISPNSNAEHNSSMSCSKSIKYKWKACEEGESATAECTPDW